jgi:hypothetical protein
MPKAERCQSPHKALVIQSICITVRTLTLRLFPFGLRVTSEEWRKRFPAGGGELILNGDDTVRQGHLFAWALHRQLNHSLSDWRVFARSLSVLAVLKKEERRRWKTLVGGLYWVVKLRNLQLALKEHTDRFYTQPRIAYYNLDTNEYSEPQIDPALSQVHVPPAPEAPAQKDDKALVRRPVWNAFRAAARGGGEVAYLGVRGFRFLYSQASTRSALAGLIGATPRVLLQYGVPGVIVNLVYTSGALEWPLAALVFALENVRTWY